MIIYIKNMVSLRCKMMVKHELRNLGLGFVTIDNQFKKVTGVSPSLYARQSRNRGCNLENM
jgi:methylphosphotriester-DNA--protein-cysteine methyltransferase